MFLSREDAHTIEHILIEMSDIHIDIVLGSCSDTANESCTDTMLESYTDNDLEDFPPLPHQ